jgi:hypothetical protein
MTYLNSLSVRLNRRFSQVQTAPDMRRIGIQAKSLIPYVHAPLVPKCPPNRRMGYPDPTS